MISIWRKKNIVFQNNFVLTQSTVKPMCNSRHKKWLSISHWLFWIKTSYMLGSGVFSLFVVHRLEWWILILNRVNSLPQTSQAYDFTPVCIRMCAVKFPFWRNNFPHWSHLWFFSPVCIPWCCLRWPLLENDFPHTSQENGFSPVCVRMWRVRSDFFEQL